MTLERDARFVCRLVATGLCSPPGALPPDPPRVPQEWARIDTLAARCGLGEALHHAAQRAMSGESRGALPHCRAAALYAEGRTRQLLHRAAVVSGALAEAGLPAIALKGLVLATTVYPAPGARLMTDIDLLVRPADLAAAEALLDRLGYVVAVDERFARRLRWTHHHLPPRRHPTFGDVIELHHGLVPRSAKYPIDVEALWRDARPLAPLPDLGALSDADLLVHQMLHLLHSSPVAGRLRDLLDLHLIAAGRFTDAGAWEALAERAARFGLTRTLAIAAHLMTRVFETAVPLGWLEALRRGTDVDDATLARFFAGVTADLCDRPDARVVRWLALRKMWLERPTAPTAARLVGAVLVDAWRGGTRE
ncbi:MAG: nucleotidyltransferase family protein [Phycisphaerae bacterium]